MMIHLSQLTLGETVQSELGEFEVIESLSQEDEVYIRLKKIKLPEEAIKEI